MSDVSAGYPARVMWCIKSMPAAHLDGAEHAVQDHHLVLHELLLLLPQIVLQVLSRASGKAQLLARRTHAARTSRGVPLH